MEHNILKKLKKVAPDKGKNNVAKRKSGIITWLNRDKGYGIVNYDQGGEVFVHYDPIYGKDYHSLKKDDQADIIPSQRRKEKPFATKQDEHKEKIAKHSHYNGIK